jgi:SNF2 family DNA or RNA helicase
VANKTASTGLTLTSASSVIYYSNSYSLEDRLQSEDRAMRIGQKKNVVYRDLVARNTVDEKIIKALRSKQNIADIILKDIAGFIS